MGAVSHQCSLCWVLKVGAVESRILSAVYKFAAIACLEEEDFLGAWYRLQVQLDGQVVDVAGDG